MAVPIPYNAGSLGPSPAGQMDQMVGQDQYALGLDRSQFLNDESRAANQYNQYTAPQLMSSLGAAGQLYGTAGKKAVGQTETNYQNQMTDLASAFNRAQMDMRRQEAYASMGLVI